MKSTNRGFAAKAGEIGVVGSGEDLNVFMTALLERHRSDNLRVVCRGGRLVEVRLDSASVFRVLGDGETARATLRQWAAHRWVKRVRPTFVLERTALATLAPKLRRRLIDFATTSGR